MATLKKLEPELKEALGTLLDLQSRYELLIEKSNEGKLKDDEEAAKYIDEVVNRYTVIKSTSPTSSALQAKKEAYLPLLRAHAAEVSVLTFSKPGDLAFRLKQLDFEPSKIDEITKGLEQAGGDDDCLAVLLSSIIITSATCKDDHHHGHGYGHSSYVVSSSGGFGTRHGHG
ncbi:coiled coil protein [Legionella steigerwaltii]|uniref:Coiled coil protein n=1 Tax=Legionella steigerwaltii TaxID=460 RepID=A0A378LCL0_9GAMM|nr:hypothetical protein [Legionella steigerwaltii]KTD79041.1 coiled coil protein [Legionella steigerwaltii]STY23632.1 coiled coil protein [Legionella steigerwaltii]